MNSFPRTLLITWWRPDARYSGGEVIRRVLGELPSDSIRWAYLSPPSGDDLKDLPENRSFSLKRMNWRLDTGLINYIRTNYFCIQDTVNQIAEWVDSFKPELIWIASEMQAIGVGLYLQGRLKIPLHVTVYDAYENGCKFGAHPPWFAGSYLRRVRNVFQVADSFDSVTRELADHVNKHYPGKPTRRSIVFPPPASVKPDNVLKLQDDCLTGRKRQIGICGSSRISDKQWQAFLDLLGSMDFEFRLIAYIDPEYFNNGALPKNVEIVQMGYAENETEILKGFDDQKVCACYLGLWREDDRELFVGTSLSSKLATYAASSLPVIVDAPEGAAAWKLISRYNAGIRLVNNKTTDAEAVNYLLNNKAAWLEMAGNSGRMHREHFDLKSNIDKLKDLLCLSAGLK